jgi:four helix bundle protein
MKINRFEELAIWKQSLAVTKEVYDYTSRPKFSKDFALREQIRRAVISISSNIVEGFEKNNNNEFIRFLKIAKGSAGETRNQLYIAQAADYLTGIELNKINAKVEDLSNQIGGLISYLENCRTQGKFIKPKTR